MLVLAPSVGGAKRGGRLTLQLFDYNINLLTGALKLLPSK